MTDTTRELAGRVAIVTGAGRNIGRAIALDLASGGAAIVNIGGLSASTGARDRAHVVTAKAGIEGFTRALAHELAPDDITVNCVSPGFINTTRPSGAPRSARHTHQSLSGRHGESQEIAATVRFLCGPGARYITGQTIHVNGGALLK